MTDDIQLITTVTDRDWDLLQQEFDNPSEPSSENKELAKAFLKKWRTENH